MIPITQHCAPRQTFSISHFPFSIFQFPSVNDGQAMGRRLSAPGSDHRDRAFWFARIVAPRLASTPCALHGAAEAPLWVLHRTRQRFYLATSTPTIDDRKSRATFVRSDRSDEGPTGTEPALAWPYPHQLATCKAAKALTTPSHLIRHRRQNQ